MNSIKKLDDWQMLILCHFSFIFSSKEMVLSDHYNYILPGLLGIPKHEILKIQLDSVKYINRTNICSDPLLEIMGQMYIKNTGIDVSNIVFHKTFKHDSFRAFIQLINDKKSIIELWTGASAIIGVLAIVIAQYDEMAKAKILHPKDEKLLKEKNQLLLKKLIQLKRLVNAWKKNKYIAIDYNSELELSAETSKRARKIFLASIEFAIYHELAHHFKGHLKDVSNFTSEKMRYNEFEADIDSISKSNFPSSRGPLVCYMASSILQDSRDILQSNSHPSLIERVQNYFSLLIELSQDKKTTNEIINGSYLPLVRTIFGNLDDRDRFPDWFGYSKKEFETTIKSRHKLTTVFNTDDFLLNDIFNIIDASKPKAQKKKLTIDFI